MRVCSRLVMVLVVIAAVAVSAGGPAGADVVSPPGACVGKGTWVKAKFTESSKDHETSDVIDIPRHDVVRWVGSLKGGQINEKTARRDIDGSVDLDLPLGQSITIDDWDKTSVRVANKGRHGYNLPVVFAGVKFKLHGHHDENGKEICSGSVYLKVDGGATSNPLFWAAIVGLVISGGALLFAGRPVIRKVEPAYEDVNPG